MRQRYGIILLDETGITIRVYQVDTTQWTLIHYQSKAVDFFSKEVLSEKTSLIEAISEMLTSDEAQHIAEWKMCARRIPEPVLNTVSSAIGISIEPLSPLREQELLSKGMFTELW